MEKVIVWIHIPKTGGKSMFKMLQQKYKTLQIYETLGGYVYSDDVDEIDDKIANYYESLPLETCVQYAKDNGYTAIIGNLVAKEIKTLCDSIYGTSELFCFLREPISRTVSEYKHNAFHGYTDTSFEEFCKRTYNTQWRQTSGDLSLFKFVGDFTNFECVVQGLGFTTEHENSSYGRSYIDVNESIAIPYNKLDTELYNSFKQKATD